MPMTLAALALGLATSAPAQEPRPQRSGQPAAATAAATPRTPIRWWKDDAVAAKLALTPSQIERIDGIFEAFLPAQRERWAVFRPLEKERDDLLRDPHPTEARVIDLITRVENLRAELNRHRLIMLFRIQQVLTPAQRTKLQDLGLNRTGGRRQ
jgi:Spy/CpxP family protein refolding chaperone